MESLPAVAAPEPSEPKRDCKEELQRIRHYVEHYERLCRLCLAADRLVNVYSNVRGRNVFYVRNFVKEGFRLLEQTIDKKDEMPNFICEKCERNLNILSNFKKKCDHSRRILEKVRNKTITPEDLKVKDEPQTDSISFKSRKEQADCETILEKLPKSINVEKVKKGSVEHKAVTCLEVSQFKTEPLDIKQEVASFGLLFPEVDGGNLELSEVTIFEELENTNDGQSESERCFEERDEESDGDWQPKKSPDKKQPPRKFDKTSLPARKVRKLLGAKASKRDRSKEKTICTICGALVNNIKCHMVIHEEVRPHQCERCPKSFTSKNKLQSHVNSVHLKKRDYKCEICGKAFLEKNNLKGHLRIHKGDRKYTCDLCPKTFLFAGTLRYHKLTHTQDKKHECQICGKMFLLRATLTKHLHVHGDERPYKCDLCDKRFRTSTHKVTHMRTHTGEKPLQCRLCGVGFAHHKARSVHMKTKHAQELLAMDMLDERGHLKY